MEKLAQIHEETMNKMFTTTSRGVSEVMGYALIFGVILIISTTATTIGFGHIDTQQKQEQISTIQNGFEIFDSDIETIQTHKDPKKQTPLNIQSGSIGYGNQTTITLGEWDGSSFTSESTTVESTHISYQADRAEIIYDSGLVFNNDRNGGILTQTKTNAVIGSEKAIIPIVVINPTNSDIAISPTGEIILESNHISDTETIEDRTVTTDGDPLWLRIESPYAAGWKKQLQEEGFTDITHTNNTVRVKVSDGTNTPQSATLSTTIIQTEIKK